MNKEAFKALFNQALLKAATKAESQWQLSLPRSFMFDLNAFGYSGPLLTFEQTVDRIFISEDKFYRVIDVAITGVHPEYAVVFIRVSGHSPSSFSDTQNPKELGPFNVMVSGKLEKLK